VALSVSDFFTEILLKAGSTTFHGNQDQDVASQGEAPRQVDPSRNQVPTDRYQPPVAGEKPAEQPTEKPTGDKGGKTTGKTEESKDEKPKADDKDSAMGKHKPGDVDKMVKNITSQLKAGKEVGISRATLPRFLAGLAKQNLKTPVDISNIRLLGTFLIGHGGKGIARIQMPQSNPPPREDFVKVLEKQGIKVTKKEVDPESLKPIQKEINGRKVGGIMKAYLKLGGYPQDQRILVTRDGHVLDGHHNWAAAIAMHILNPSMKLPVYEIDDTWKGAYDKMKAWNKELKVEGKSMSKSENPVSQWLMEPLLSLYVQKGGRGSGRYPSALPTDIDLIKAERGVVSPDAVLHTAHYRQADGSLTPVRLHIEPRFEAKKLAREYGTRRLQGARLISLLRESEA
jgi:hypothetical protein